MTSRNLARRLERLADSLLPASQIAPKRDAANSRP
jgi:hypothetical protein